jgi:hypothetical protein
LLEDVTDRRGVLVDGGAQPRDRRRDAQALGSEA